MAITDCRCPQSGCELCGLPDDTRKQLQQLQADVKRLQEKLEATKGQLRYSGDPFYDDAADAEEGGS